MVVFYQDRRGESFDHQVIADAQFRSILATIDPANLVGLRDRLILHETRRPVNGSRSTSFAPPQEERATSRRPR